MNLFKKTAEIIVGNAESLLRFIMSRSLSTRRKNQIRILTNAEKNMNLLFTYGNVYLSNSRTRGTGVDIVSRFQALEQKLKNQTPTSQTPSTPSTVKIDTQQIDVSAVQRDQAVKTLS